MPNIKLNIQGQQLKFAAIVYNHRAFPLLLGRRVLKRLKVITDWETCTWSMKTANGMKELPVNFDTDFEIQSLDDNSKMEEESHSEAEEHSDTTESEGNESEQDLEVFMMISNELKQISDNELEIIEGTPEIAPIPNLNVSETEKIKLALEATIAKVAPKY